MTTTDYIFFGTLFAIIFGGLVVYLLYVAFRCAEDPEYRGEVMKDVERMKKEKAAKKAARRAYEREMERRDPNYKYRGSIGACGWGG